MTPTSHASAVEAATPHRGVMRRVLVALAVAASCLALGASTATADETPEALRCAPGAGVWRVPSGAGSSSDDGELSLRATLCHVGAPDEDDGGGACPLLTNLHFEDGAARAEVAQAPAPLRSCEMRWQGAVGRFALYHDGDALVAIDTTSLRVVWRGPQPRLRTATPIVAA